MKSLAIIIFPAVLAVACKKTTTTTGSSAPAIVSFSPTSGLPGTEIIITGTNFDENPQENTVKINGSIASITEGSSTELRVKVSSRATTGKISISNSAGTGKSTSDFEVLPFVNGWLQVKSFPAGMRDMVSFVIGNKAYVTTGATENYAMQDMLSYDPETDSWTKKADFAGQLRTKAIAFALNGKGYVGLGNTGGLGFAKELYEYDPGTDKWTKKADFKGVAREYACVFTIGGKAYVGLGNNGDPTYKKDFWEYDPLANTWTQKTNFGGPALTIATGFSIGNKGYIAGGYDGVSYSSDLWEYDPATNTWTEKAYFPGTPRGYAVAFTIGSKGYFGTGFGQAGISGDFLLDLWEYDSGSNKWKQKANIGGVKRSGAVGFAIGSKGYIGTGNNGSFLSDFWEYTQ